VQESEKERVIHRLFTDNEGLTQFGFVNAVTAMTSKLDEATPCARARNLYPFCPTAERGVTSLPLLPHGC